MHDKPTICMVPDGCDRPVHARGMCSRHFQQAQRGTRPFILPSRQPLPRTATPEERFWIKVDKTDECWLWTAATMDNGYGVFWDGNTQILAHRFIYEIVVGPISVDGEIDHLCRVRNCVKPDHLELVSRAENIARQRHHGPPRLELCGRGHDSWKDLPSGKRHCTECVKENVRAYRKRQRGTS